MTGKGRGRGRGGEGEKKGEGEKGRRGEWGKGRGERTEDCCLLLIFQIIKRWEGERGRGETGETGETGTQERLRRRGRVMSSINITF